MPTAPALSSRQVLSGVMHMAPTRIVRGGAGGADWAVTVTGAGLAETGVTS
ncbi:hypothetical protein [Microvirga massiliensis]|uniref:hypothetical protein n=1 Tax=Microvirga massiliensis TaxID=1033741 RepID=UPI0012B6A6AF|nr:hypothetical protein [Microvirga massiliensis]